MGTFCGVTTETRSRRTSTGILSVAELEGIRGEGDTIFFLINMCTQFLKYLIIFGCWVDGTCSYNFCVDPTLRFSVIDPIYEV